MGPLLLHLEETTVRRLKTQESPRNSAGRGDRGAGAGARPGDGAFYSRALTEEPGGVVLKLSAALTSCLSALFLRGAIGRRRLGPSNGSAAIPLLRVKVRNGSQMPPLLAAALF